MKRLVRQAFIVSLSRFANQALMMIGPMVLVRLLPVEEFGRYREFLMYSAILGSFASLSLGSSLLYFLGIEPGARWGYVRRVVLATAVMTVLSLAIFGLIDLAAGGRLVGRNFWLLALYVTFFCNVDFWEYLWLAQRKAESALLYTAGRLVLRMAATIMAAAWGRNLEWIVWSLVVLEGLRLLASVVYWRHLVRTEPSEPVHATWRSQLIYAVPSGLAVSIWQLEEYMGGIYVSQTIGHAAMAFLSIGGYALLILSPLRNAISDVLMPELASRSQGGASEDWVPLWQRALVLYAMLVMPLGAFMCRFAGPIVTTAFSARYAPAIPVFQIFSMILFMGWIDSALALRVLNQTRYILVCVLICVPINFVLLWWLVPRYGITGAAAAQFITQMIAILYMVMNVARILKRPLFDLLPTWGLSRVACATAFALAPVLPDFWAERFGVAGVVGAGVLYAGVFLAALKILRIPEAEQLVEMLLRKFGLARFARP